MMKRLLYLSLLAIAVVLTACKIDDAPAEQQSTPQFFISADGTLDPNMTPMMISMDPTMAAAFEEINNLAVGTLYLQTTSHPITREQAALMLPYWQFLEGERQPGQPPDFTGMADTASKIKAVLTADQIAIIDAMTEDERIAILEQYGASAGGQFVFSAGQGGPGDAGPFVEGTPGVLATARAQGTPFPTLDPDQIATFQADGGSVERRGNPIFEEVIKALEAIING